MRSAVVILSLVAAVAAEAPYQLPQPAPQAPAFNYPAPAPAPQAPPSVPVPQPNFGYQYQPPSIQPAFVQPAPQPQINYQPQPAPPPLSLPQVAPEFGYNYPQPPPQQVLRQPQPQQFYQPQPQPQPQPQSIRYTQPSPSYGLPQLQIAQRPSLIQSPVQPFTAQQPQSQPAQVYQPIAYQQQQQSNFQSGYSYPQQTARTAPSLPQLPLQSQSFSNSQPTAYSSYQADSQQYSGAQGQSPHELLDSVVIGRVSNIIKDDEHSSAKSAGYQSLVSGVSLENVQPSLEVLSFVHNSPLAPSQSTGTSESVSSAEASSSGPSPDYGLPTITANSQSTSQDSSRFSFLPQTQPATSYGQPSSR